jgi:hypothetical protein
MVQRETKLIACFEASGIGLEAGSKATHAIMQDNRIGNQPRLKSGGSRAEAIINLFVIHQKVLPIRPQSEKTIRGH